MATTTSLSDTAQRELSGFTGELIGPADPGYDDARRLYNAMIDKRPAVIARCVSADDVAAAIGFARRHGALLAVRGGGHNGGGLGVCDDGVVVDLGLLRGISIDADARTVRVGGGCTWGEVDRATHEVGMATPSGIIGTTGVGGLTLGGGIGHLSRRHGLTIDNLLEAEVVLADGSRARASERENPDLFWAIRGGGGNFGVVTGFEFQLHEAGPLVQFGLFFWSLDQAPATLRLARQITAALPPELNAVIAAVNAPPAPFVPEQHHLRPGYALLLAGFGSAQEHAALVAQIRESLPPLFDLVTPMPYVELQKLLDEANAWGFCCYDKGAYLEDLSDPVIEAVTEHVPRKTSPMSALLFYRLDGAYTRVGDEQTAFSGGRSPRYAAFIVGLTPDVGGLAAERAWVRGFWQALRPYAIDGADGYINSTSEYSGEGIRGSYGPGKYQRLAKIKAEYDPDNTFRLNANIPPG
jgi:FAD/FMN-containing dehydrogenase